MNMNNGVLQMFDVFKSMDFYLVASLASHLHPLKVEADKVIYCRGDRAADSKMNKT